MQAKKIPHEFCGSLQTYHLSAKSMRVRAELETAHRTGLQALDAARTLHQFANETRISEKGLAFVVRIIDALHDRLLPEATAAYNSVAQELIETAIFLPRSDIVFGECAHALAIQVARMLFQQCGGGAQNRKAWDRIRGRIRAVTLPDPLEITKRMTEESVGANRAAKSKADGKGGGMPMTVGAFCDRLGIASGTLKPYYAKAGVKPPKQGGRDHIFSAEDIRKLCKALETGSNKTRNGARELGAEYQN